jgi:alkylation response protein AidB-like acyl-CoA dehydrogenase
VALRDKVRAALWETFVTATKISDLNFTPPAAVTELAAKVKAFVKEKVVPYETDPRWGAHGPSEELRIELNDLARAAGVFAPQVPKEYGGVGLSQVGRAYVFEAAGYSILGPTAIHCASPDEGNIHLLDVVARPDQREHFLKPLAMGKYRSCFCMTEPDGGAGSDPSLMKTTARLDGNEWVINGRKWLITGAGGAGFAIVMARIDGGEHDGKATMFLVDMPNPAIKHERTLDTIDSSFTGGHAVLNFDNLRLPAEAVLGEIGKGFRYAQVRLAPARLSHCMRWLGSAGRAQEIATDYARQRVAFGKRIGEHQGVSFMLADNMMDIHMARLAIWHTAWLLDQGERASNESSLSKVVCSEAIARVADRCLQILGGMGITRDTVVERIFRDTRAFRIYDGPSEVHRAVLGERIVKGGL